VPPEQEEGGDEGKATRVFVDVDAVDHRRFWTWGYRP
jgi:hypothetical protein